MPTSPRIRTFHARHGRTTDAMRTALEELAPTRSLHARREVDRPLVVEVGCGHGEAAVAFAHHRPDVDVLAVDVHVPGIARLLMQIAESGPPNLYVERGDAVELLDGPLAGTTIAGLHLFFPDPWPKARHHKRRFVRPDLLDLVAERIEPGGWFRFATDVDDYADAATALLDDHASFTVVDHSRPGWRPVAGYERRALDAGRAIHDRHVIVNGH